MRVVVEHVRGKDVAQLRKNGWKAYHDRRHKLVIPLSEYRRISGYEMVKDFRTMGFAIREFEAITGHDVITDKDQSGCAIYVFKCIGEYDKTWCSGWLCGQYMFEKWHGTPRECLEALNKNDIGRKEIASRGRP